MVPGKRLELFSAQKCLFFNFLIFNFFFSLSSGVVGARSVPGSSDQGANFAFPDGYV